MIKKKGVTLHQEIAAELRARIDNGEWPPDTRLPSEPELSAHFGVCRMTVRQALGELEALLYVGAAQILYMPDVPDLADVSETVKAAKSSPNRSVAKVVNGVLRNLLRRRAELEAAIASAPLAERESFPDALVERWTVRYGADAAARLAAWHNQPAETYLAYRGGESVLLPRGRHLIRSGTWHARGTRDRSVLQ